VTATTTEHAMHYTTKHCTPPNAKQSTSHHAQYITPCTTHNTTKNYTTHSAQYTTQHQSPPSTSMGKLKDFTYSTHSACPFRERLKHPNRSPGVRERRNKIICKYLILYVIRIFNFSCLKSCYFLFSISKSIKISFAK
jgi:hypothetical protein